MGIAHRIGQSTVDPRSGRDADGSRRTPRVKNPFEGSIPARWCARGMWKAILALLLTIPPLVGQSHVQPSRIIGLIDNHQRVKLLGNAPLEGRPEYDNGPVDPSFALTYVTLHVRPTQDQRKALDQLLSDQQDRSSQQGQAAGGHELRQLAIEPR